MARGAKPGGTVVRVELARATDMFETPAVVLGSTVGGFTPGIDQCIAEVASQAAAHDVKLEVALPGDQIEDGLAAKMTVSLDRFCKERIYRNECERSAIVRTGLGAFRIGLPMTLLGLLITVGATKIGDIDDALRAVVDIIGWVLAWVGLWYPFDKFLFYPLDRVHENHALEALRKAEVRIVALDVDAPKSGP
jgi:hypothetical protein